MLVIGIDEAGRGPVIGPMVICGFGISESNLKILENNEKVNDSKLLSREDRENLYDYLLSIGEFIKIVEINPSEINMLMGKRLSLTSIEINAMKKILESVEKDCIVYVDSPSVNKKRILEKLKEVKNPNIKRIVVEYKADRKFKVVSAASIVAKVIRDRKIDEIKKIVGVDIGSGYPSDERTISFLKEIVNDPNYDAFVSKYVRTHWNTYKKLKKESKQALLTDFFT